MSPRNGKLSRTTQTDPGSDWSAERFHLNRNAVLAQVRVHLPLTAPWADECCWSVSNLARADQQGDPPGAAFFALATHPIICCVSSCHRSQAEVDPVFDPRSVHGFDEKDCLVQLATRDAVLTTVWYDLMHGRLWDASESDESEQEYVLIHWMSRTAGASQPSRTCPRNAGSFRGLRVSGCMQVMCVREIGTVVLLRLATLSASLCVSALPGRTLLGLRTLGSTLRWREGTPVHSGLEFEFAWVCRSLLCSLTTVRQSRPHEMELLGWLRVAGFSLFTVFAVSERWKVNSHSKQKLLSPWTGL